MNGESVYTTLREQIVSGAYRAGERLTEVALSASLSVSRTPVREALRRLESDGLVEASNRGVTVTTLSASALQHAYAVRAALETLTAEIAAQRQQAGEIAPAALTALDAEASNLEQVTAGGDLGQAIALNRRFHLGVAALAGNPIALEILDRLWNQITVSTLSSLLPNNRPAVVAAEHRLLLRAITEGDSTGAGQIAGDHARGTARAAARASTEQPDAQEDRQ